MTVHIDAASKAEILEALQREREYLLSRKMYGAEHILVKYAINVIDDMESATTAKRKIGTWKFAFPEEENVYECSECGKYWFLNDGSPFDNEMNFCPKCGAQMCTLPRTCGDCYWYSDVTVHVCEREKEPTSADQEACPMFEPKERRGMLSGDCNICINGKLPSDSATCVECGLSRKNYKPVIPSSEDEIDEAQRDYQAAVDYQQYCEMYEPTYDPETGAM